MNNINNAAIPYWVLALATLFDIISIWFDRNINTEKDIVHRLNRIRLSIIPKIIFVAIYTWFAFYPTISQDVKALHGRNSLFILMLFDFFIHSTNILESNTEKIKIYSINFKLYLNEKILKKYVKKGK